MTLETFLQGASLLQLTEALVSKSHQVFVLLPLTTRTHVTFGRFRALRLIPSWNTRPIF